MEDLILITGAYRLDNLLSIAKSINKEYDKYNSLFNIYWLICKDQYNGFGNIQTNIDYLETTNIKYQIINTGKPNQKNYGGDLFNEPLKQFVSEHNLNNPWVYILDDDNIIHPNLFKIFQICLENHFFGNKEIITTINKWHCGHNREIIQNTFLLPDPIGWIYEWFLFDPSSVILKYNIIEKYDFISNEFLYDFNWLNLKVIANERNNTIWFNDYEYSCGRHIVGSYHNGLVHQEDIQNLLNINIDDLNIDILLGNIDVELPQNVPILSSETKRKILELIKQELNNN